MVLIAELVKVSIIKSVSNLFLTSLDLIIYNNRVLSLTLCWLRGDKPDSIDDSYPDLLGLPSPLSGHDGLC